MSDEIQVGATEAASARADDVSLVAQQLSSATSQVDAR